MEYSVRADLCTRVGVRLTDLCCRGGRDGLQLCGHMEAGPEYRADPEREPVVVADLLDEEGRVLDSLRAWHQGIFSQLGYTTFCLSTGPLDPAAGDRVRRISLYVALSPAD